jgi:hypothetical protein
MPKSPPPETLAWLHQAARIDGATYAQVLLIILERLELLEDALQQSTVKESLTVGPTLEAALVVTDEELLAMRSWSSHRPIFDSELVEFGRSCYDLGRKHGAAQPPAAQPAPVVALGDALIKAECALSDIAEGEPNTDEGDPLQWAEQRCVKALRAIRPVMQQHKIRTSEYPPAAQPAPPAAPAGGLVERVVKVVADTTGAELWYMDLRAKDSARAAIREVAYFLGDLGYRAAKADLLEQVADRG